MKSPPIPRSATIQHRIPCHLRVCIKPSLLHTHAAKSPVCFWFQLEQMEQQLEKILDSVQVDSKKFGMLANWQRDFTMENILMQLKKEMTASHILKIPAAETC